MSRPCSRWGLFFTVVTECRWSILIHANAREAIILMWEALPFRIDGWALLPNHLHAIWTLVEGDADFSTRWRMIKRHVTHICGPAYRCPDHLTEQRVAKQCGTFWQHLICDKRDFSHHLDHLPGNPLKHDLGGRVADWSWSSFHRWVRQAPILPIGPVSGAMGGRGRADENRAALATRSE